MTKLTKAEELEAARNLEPDDCDIAAVGNGRYTHAMAERRAERRAAKIAAEAPTGESAVDALEVTHGSR